MKIWPILICLSVACGKKLQKYNVDRSKISTSGVSSGAAMATQLHVAYSSLIMGTGLIAGNPYSCANGSPLTAWTACMNNPSLINISQLVSRTNDYAKMNYIDATENLHKSRVFIFDGKLDSVVNPKMGPKINEYYRNYINGVSNIHTVYDVNAQHTFPTVNYGNACNYLGSPYIGACKYNAAYEILTHIYPGLKKPPNKQVSPKLLKGDFYEFDQAEFFPSLMTGMGDVGFVYVPSQCKKRSNVCRLHVALHGCQQGKYLLGDQFAKNTGYNEVGELNNIIILYPQATVSFVNPMGCWDFWGYTGSFHATRNGSQPVAISRMIDRASKVQRKTQKSGNQV